jgi:hypothetical protein
MAIDARISRHGLRNGRPPKTRWMGIPAAERSLQRRDFKGRGLPKRWFLQSQHLETLIKRSASQGGRLVTCGATIKYRHPRLEIDLLQSLPARLHDGNKGLVEAMQCVAEGKIRAIVDTVFPMRELPAAHTYLEERRAFGKVVVSGFDS